MRREIVIHIRDWWRAIDQTLVLLVLFLIAIGVFMAGTASPAVAERIGLESFYFLKRQIIFAGLSLILIILTSSLSFERIHHYAVSGYGLGLLLLVATLVIGVEVKGARRWLSIAGVSLQPSELVKPCFVIVTGWMLAQRHKHPQFLSFVGSFGLYSLIIVLLALQPDFGMIITYTLIWGAMVFLAGLSWWWVGLGALGVGVGGLGGYVIFPHVARRINSFFDPSAEGNYQVNKSLEAFHNGGFFGTGPGEGVIKAVLPDSHTDFVFAVIGEELGFIPCLIILGCYAGIIYRGITHVLRHTSPLSVYIVAGLVMHIALQALINIGVSLNVLPTKGMTLPFISYGGSSMLSTALSMGVILAMTRKEYRHNSSQYYDTSSYLMGR